MRKKPNILGTGRGRLASGFRWFPVIVRGDDKRYRCERKSQRIKRVKKRDCSYLSFPFFLSLIEMGHGAWGRGNVPGRAASALRASLVKFHFVHRPYGPFHIFDSHETFVERQVVSHCVLYKIIHRLNKQRKKRTKPTQSRPR